MTTSNQGAIRFDARPLTDPVDPQAVKAFTAEMRARRGSMNAGTVVAIVVGIVALVIAVPIIGFSAYAMFASGVPHVMLLPFLLILGVALVIGVIGLFSYRRTREQRYRIARFAAANNMTYEDQIDNPPLPGMIFQYGSSRRASMLVRGTSPRFVEFGNYQYTVKSGKNSTTYRWGYVAVKLDVPLPNIVLDAVGNNGFGSNLPSSFDKDQRLSLEGDFDRYFTLYCPEGYERDALYLFTPDIMARFIDAAAELDVEIVDDWLFLYTRREASTLDPATWAWLFGVVGALITKFDQWARWRDERLPASTANPGAAPTPTPGALPFAPPVGMIAPPPGVAHQGRRLKKNGGWVWIIAAVIVIVVTFWMRSF